MSLQPWSNLWFLLALPCWSGSGDLPPEGLGCSNTGMKASPHFQAKLIWPLQLNSLLSFSPGQTSSPHGRRCSERISPEIPGARDSALSCLPVQVWEPHYQISGVLTGLWREKKAGFGQPWECFSCQNKKLNDLVIEKKVPRLFKPGLNPGCLIVPSCSTTPSQPNLECPMRGPDQLATQAKCREDLLLAKLDPELNTENPMSAG